MSDNISIERLTDVLIGAFEGGSGYWLKKVDLKTGATLPDTDENFYASPAFWAHPFEIVLTTIEGTEHVLTKESIDRGLRLLQEKDPDDVEVILAGEEDGNTSDRLLQFAAFGEIVYG